MRRVSRPALQLWFEFASTYSYPAVQRIEALADGPGVGVEWKPFLLGPVFKNQGWNDSPFNLYPAKGRYMWRDLERLCAKYGLPFRRPSVFPRSTPRRARRLHGGGRALVRRLRARRVPRQLRRGPQHRQRRDGHRHPRGNDRLEDAVAWAVTAANRAADRR